MTVESDVYFNVVMNLDELNISNKTLFTLLLLYLGYLCCILCQRRWSLCEVTTKLSFLTKKYLEIRVAMPLSIQYLRTRQVYPIHKSRLKPPNLKEIKVTS